mmetsp:Transcript_4075/g.5128  ORF Transcript_4075/g.5128 Transcript_4075/m.5128 type:complete len:198 (+) Transcript_4075:218-811(+)
MEKMFRLKYLQPFANKPFRKSNYWNTQVCFRGAIENHSLRRWRNLSSTPTHKSFIEIAASDGVHALVRKAYPISQGFDKCMQTLQIDSFDQEKGEVFCSLVVDESLKNAFGTLHGGAIATIVDIAGTLAILAKDDSKPGVSVELNVSFISAARLNSKVLIHGNCLKLGRKLAYTEVTLSDAATKNIIATGRHTKFVA